MTSPPLISSARACAAVERLGFRVSRRAAGSHQPYVRDRLGGGHDHMVVPLNKNPIPRGTLREMLRTGNVTLDEFVAALR